MIDLINKIEYIKNTMISVSTGGMRIQEINEEYKKIYRLVNIELKNHGIANPNPFSDLWEWYGKWSSGDLPKYRDRRKFISELFKNLIHEINNQDNFEELQIELEGWDRIERSVGEIKLRLRKAQNEEQFQAIGLLCRETIITLAQEVYDAEKHPVIDEVTPSETDAKRMLEAFISIELSGSSNESLRRYARVTNNLTNELTHKRTATLKFAKLCSSACINLVNLIRIINE